MRAALALEKLLLELGVEVVEADPTVAWRWSMSGFVQKLSQ